MQTIDLILLDIDNTLVYARGSGRESVRAAMLEVFGETGDLDNHKFSGKTDWQTLTELLGLDEDAVGLQMPTFEAAMERHLTRLIVDFPVEACEGVLDTMNMLQARDDMLLGIITGNVSTTAPIKLSAAGITPDAFVVGAFGSEALDRNRLTPMALERATLHLGRAVNPANVLVVGDTPMDVACARAIGAVAVGVCTGSGREIMQAAQPDYLLDDLTDFVRLFNL